LTHEREELFARERLLLLLSGGVERAAEHDGAKEREDARAREKAL
jgi:hypothetical protein